MNLNFQEWIPGHCPLNNFPRWSIFLRSVSHSLETMMWRPILLQEVEMDFHLTRTGWNPPPRLIWLSHVGLDAVVRCLRERWSSDLSQNQESGGLNQLFPPKATLRVHLFFSLHCPPGQCVLWQMEESSGSNFLLLVIYFENNLSIVPLPSSLTLRSSGRPQQNQRSVWVHL